jgi:threonine/homoserine/homoserine lactone efflux protein
MSLFMPFLFGFIAAVVGVFPPGILNLTASKIRVNEGFVPAVLFVSGAGVIVFFQTYVAVLFANYINVHDEIIVLIREIGMIVFAFLSIYFLFFAERQEQTNQNNIKVKSKKSHFFMGMVLSAINFLPIPYYVILTVTLASYKLFVFDIFSIYSLVIGVVLGSLLMFYAYIAFFNKLKSKTDFFMKYMNEIIGGIAGVLSVLCLYNVIKYYFFI